MAHLFQVGAGSGGMPVLDLICRDSRITRVTLVEPDVYKPHNVVRHIFPPADVGVPKAVLAERWLKEFRPDLEVRTLTCDLLDPAQQATLQEFVAQADLGVCAADNEPAKFHFDALMRQAGKPWTLGEVLAGGIGGLVHWFVPGGPCYGCVASFFQRSVKVAEERPPDYSQAGGAIAETTVPASRASISAIASLHALITLGLLADPAAYNPGFTSLLLTLERVEKVFDEAFRPFRFRIPRSAECLTCRADATPSSSEDLDVALAQALRDWAMHDLWPIQRFGCRPQALHFSYEKAGLTVHDQPIPWNAEAVLIEALVKLPAGRSPADFQLRIENQPPLNAETIRRDEADDRHHLFFRLPPPTRSTCAELLWRTTSLGQISLPVLTCDDFVGGLRVQMPALFVRLGEQSVACQTFVASQCRGLLASAVITSPTSLAPLRDLGLQVEFRAEWRGGPTYVVNAPLTSSQLAGQHALISLLPPKVPRRVGVWSVSWRVGNRPLLTQRFRAISQAQFQRSLRICDTRFLIHSAKHGMSLHRQVPPLEPADRVGPCFLVASGEAGMAGICNLHVHAQVNGARMPVLAEQDVLVTDGPTLVVPGTVDMNDLQQVHGFEVRVKDMVLGSISLNPAPAADFNSEGGFKQVEDFIWTAAAEEELSKRLGGLMGNPKP